ncbi:MAG: thioesterase family protein [Actinomycetota bacterium]
MTANEGLTAGLEGAARDTVTEAMTADHVRSGDVRALATPVVLALVERAAVASLAGKLPEGSTSVGAAVELAHLAPTPVGAVVTARARLDEVEGGRRLTFSFSVTDPAGEVATGTHVRVVVDRDRFEQTALERER